MTTESSPKRPEPRQNHRRPISLFDNYFVARIHIITPIPKKNQEAEDFLASRQVFQDALTESACKIFKGPYHGVFAHVYGRTIHILFAPKNPRSYSSEHAFVSRLAVKVSLSLSKLLETPCEASCQLLPFYPQDMICEYFHKSTRQAKGEVVKELLRSVLIDEGNTPEEAFQKLRPQTFEQLLSTLEEKGVNIDVFPAWFAKGTGICQIETPTVHIDPHTRAANLVMQPKVLPIPELPEGEQLDKLIGKLLENEVLDSDYFAS